MFGSVWMSFGMDWMLFGLDWNAFGIVWMMFGMHWITLCVLLNTVKIVATILREAGWVAMVFPLPFLNSCVDFCGGGR
jgi:hypothetical protein